MGRAEMRRLARQARKEGVSVDSYYSRPAVSDMMEQKRLAENTAKVLEAMGTEFAVERAYQDTMRLYDEQFSKAIVIACSMMLRDAFPRWRNKTIERHVQVFMDYMDMYGTDYKYDIGKFKDLYAITFGEPLIMVHEDKKPPLGKERPR